MRIENAIIYGNKGAVPGVNLPMEKKPLYTIGHGNRRIDELLALLKEYGIGYLVDVRSQPYSKFNPQFNRENLERSAKEEKIRYVYMGDLLGGRPKDLSCYTYGRVDHELIKTKDFFKKGIRRLKTAYEKDLLIAIMCSESKPSECHRTKLIGEALAADNIILKHINEHGKLKEHADVIKMIKKKNPGGGLFTIVP